MAILLKCKKTPTIKILFRGTKLMCPGNVDTCPKKRNKTNMDYECISHVGDIFEYPLHGGTGSR